MTYRIIERDTIPELESVVNLMLKEGWKLQGGVCITPETEHKCSGVSQALTLDGEE